MIDNAGNVVMQVTLKRCDGPVALWNSITSIYQYLHITTTEFPRGYFSVILSGTQTVTDDEIILDLVGTSTKDLSKVTSGPWKFRLNTFFTEDEAIPSCGTCYPPMWLESGAYGPTCS